MAGLPRKRAEVAVDEAMDVYAHATSLAEYVLEAMSDGVIDQHEATEIHRRTLVGVAEATQVVIATEYTAVGQKIALGHLAGTPSQRAAIEEMQIRQRAAEVHYTLNA